MLFTKANGDSVTREWFVPDWPSALWSGANVRWDTAQDVVAVRAALLSIPPRQGLERFFVAYSVRVSGGEVDIARLERGGWYGVHLHLSETDGHTNVMAIMSDGWAVDLVVGGLIGAVLGFGAGVAIGGAAILVAPIAGALALAHVARGYGLLRPYDIVGRVDRALGLR